MPQTRKLAAIMFTDIKDFTKRMNASESLGMRLMQKHNEIMDGAIQRHQGVLVKNIGDAYLVDFGSAVNAVEAAVDAQGLFAGINKDAGADEEILVRISIHLGDVVVQGSDVFGDGVNVASRLQSITPPGGICISRDVYTHVKSRMEADCVSIGSYALKGVTEPVDVYQVLTTLVPRPIVSPAHAPGGEKQAAPDASIAVLPFSNWSDDKESEYFSDGITEDIITDLAKISSLRVSSRNSVFFYKGKTVEMKKVGAEMNVRYVLEGSVRKAGSRLRITAQLIEAESNAHVWAERWDRDMADVFAIQDEIARHIAGELRVRLTKDQENAIENKGTRSVPAYDEYLKGLFYSRKRTKADLDQAVEHLQAALSLDPDFAQAHSTLAWTLRLQYADGFRREPSVIEETRMHAERALSLDPQLPDALLMKGARPPRGKQAAGGHPDPGGARPAVSFARRGAWLSWDCAQGSGAFRGCLSAPWPRPRARPKGFHAPVQPRPGHHRQRKCARPRCDDRQLRGARPELPRSPLPPVAVGRLEGRHCRRRLLHGSD